MGSAPILHDPRQGLVDKLSVIVMGSANSTWGKLILPIYCLLLQPQVTLSPFPVAASIVGIECCSQVAEVDLLSLVPSDPFLLFQ